MRPSHFGMSIDTAEEASRRKGIDRAVLKRAWSFAVKYKRLLGYYSASSIVLAIIGVIPPIIFKRFIDTAIPNRDLRLVNVLAILAIAIAMVSALIGVLIRWFGAKIGEGIIFDLRCALFDHVQRMPIAFFTRTQTGSLMSRLNNDVVGAQQAFTVTLRSTLTDFLTVATTIVAMGAMSWKLTALSFCVVPFLLFASKRVGKATQLATRDQMDRNAKMNSTMTERFNVSGALLVKLFGRREAESLDFSVDAAGVRDSGIRRAMTGIVLFIALPMVGALGTASVYWFGSRQVLSGAITTGTVVAMSAYVQRLYQPLTELASTRIDFLTAFVSFERVFEILDAPILIQEAAEPKHLTAPRGEIVFDHVSFRYPAASQVTVKSLEKESTAALGQDASEEILRDVSFTAKPGTMTAIVGTSGAGKTTISSLIPRLYDVTEGSIRFDGTDVRELFVNDLIANIGVVTQDAHMFHDSLVGNLKYAKPDATLDEIIAACKAARIHDLISSLPDGYATTVGERGYRLSGGEKQRVALARVLLKNPSVVILDEATAHLDSETEVLIQRALDEALEGRTSIVIAHRLSTIQNADQILVLQAGKIVEQGVHNDLITQGGLYSELYETQFERNR